MSVHFWTSALRQPGRLLGRAKDLVYERPESPAGCDRARSAIAIAKKFPWKQYKTFIDVGGAQGCVPVQVALAHRI